MNYTPSKNELEMLRRRTKHLYCKLELLNPQMELLNSLEGLTIDGSISIDSTSDIRRTFSATIYVEGDQTIASMLGDE